MYVPQWQQLVKLFEALTLWQCVKWLLTVLIVGYFLKEYVFKPKQILSPEERAKRRYWLANTDVMRTMRATQRQQFEETMQNTAKNVKIQACEDRQKKNSALRKTVVISEEKNVYYEHTDISGTTWNVTTSSIVTRSVSEEIVSLDINYEEKAFIRSVSEHYETCDHAPDSQKSPIFRQGSPVAKTDMPIKVC